MSMPGGTSAATAERSLTKLRLTISTCPHTDRLGISDGPKTVGISYLGRPGVPGSCPPSGSSGALRVIAGPPTGSLGACREQHRRRASGCRLATLIGRRQPAADAPAVVRTGLAEHRAVDP